jgi:ATP-dependent Clp protease ATP-binding subunit ClpC
MSSPSSEAELVQLRKLAEAQAKQRRERPTTVHLLAALFGQPGPARELLAARRLEEPTVLKAARTFDEEMSDAIGHALDSARKLAHLIEVPSPTSYTSSRTGVRAAPPPAPGGAHVLVALLSNRRFAACRALDQLGVDVGRLRQAARQIALGLGTAPKQDGSARDAALRPSATRPSIGTGGGLDPASRGAPQLEARKPAPSSGKRPSPAVQVPLFPELQGAPKRPSRVIEVRTVAEQVAPAAASTPRMTPRASKTDPGGRFERYTLDPERFPTLASVGRNLTLCAARGELDPVIGREAEIEQTLDVLCKRHANSALLVGPPGVGKTSVARGMALRFAAESGATPARLLIELPCSELMAGTATRGALGERAAAIRSELHAAQGRVVLFIDEIHDLLCGSADELVAELKAGLARGELPLVAATTLGGYHRAIECDGVLARRFTLVEIEEPDEQDSFLLLRSVADALAKHHGVSYSDEAIAVTVSWSIRYLPGRALPDKAVSILDLAGARVRRRASGALPPSVGREPIAAIVCELADVPVERLLQTDRERMLGLEQLLGERVVGHPEALGRIAAVLRRNAAGLRGRRPIGTFLLLGPTGVGKTETAKAVAEALFHSADAMTRLDMSEYSEPHAVARMIGAPPGYVGHEAGGELTEAVRRRPYQVVLLDEIEKAHRDVLEAFLQVFDEGRLTDGRGRTVDLTNTVIVLTSNLGADELRSLASERRVGFGSSSRPTLEPAKVQEVALRAARTALPPELYNRLDEVIVYSPLTREHIHRIADRLLESLGATLADRGVELEITASVVEALMAAGGFEPELGARPMKRAIARLIEAPLADRLLSGELSAGSVATVVVAEGEIAIQVSQRRKAKTA